MSMTNTTKELAANFLQDANNIIDWSQSILDAAYLTNTQQEDMHSVHDAARKFHTLTNATFADTLSDGSPQEIQHLRHRMRNHLNIIVGFTRIWLRDLPDNLLLQMATIRQIHRTGKHLLKQVNDHLH